MTGEATSDVTPEACYRRAAEVLGDLARHGVERTVMLAGEWRQLGDALAHRARSSP